MKITKLTLTDSVKNDFYEVHFFAIHKGQKIEAKLTEPAYDPESNQTKQEYMMSALTDAIQIIFRDFNVPFDKNNVTKIINEMELEVKMVDVKLKDVQVMMNQDTDVNTITYSVSFDGVDEVIVENIDMDDFIDGLITFGIQPENKGLDSQEVFNKFYVAYAQIQVNKFGRKYGLDLRTK